METITEEEFQKLRIALSPTYVIFSPRGAILSYSLGPNRGWLGSLEKLILEELLNGPSFLADLTRKLGRRRQHIHRALQRLELRGLLTSQGIPGFNLEGTPVLRRLYSLREGAALLAVPITTPSEDDLREEAELAQARGILHQLLGHAREKLDSPDMKTRSLGHRILDDLDKEIQQLKAQRTPPGWRETSQHQPPSAPTTPKKRPIHTPQPDYHHTKSPSPP